MSWKYEATAQLRWRVYVGRGVSLEKGVKFSLGHYEMDVSLELSATATAEN